MATIVQHNYNIIDATSPCDIALPGNATTGNTVLLVFGWYDVPGTLATPTDANGTYQTVFNPANNASANGLSVFYVPNCTGGVTHATVIQGVSAAPDNNFYCSCALYEISGLTTSPFDKVSPGGTTSNGGSGQTTQATGSTGTLSQANEWAFVACTFDDNPGVTNEKVTVPSGYTVDPNILAYSSGAFQNTLNNIGLQVGWQEIAATTALNPSFGINLPSGQPTLTSTYAVIATFKESGGFNIAWLV